MHMAPDCSPWSISSNGKHPALRHEDRLRDYAAISTVQEAAEGQSRDGHVYNVEQPLGSAMW